MSELPFCNGSRYIPGMPDSALASDEVPSPRQSQTSSGSSPLTKLQHCLRLEWWAWTAISIGWLGGLLWLSHKPENWPQNPVAWWTGDLRGSRPMWPMMERVDGHMRIEPVDGDSAYVAPLQRGPSGDRLTLGCWRGRDEEWSMSVWVFLDAEDSGLLPQAVLAQARSDRIENSLGLDSGRLFVRQASLVPPWVQPQVRPAREAKATVPMPLRRWVHVTLVNKPLSIELFQDGQLQAKSEAWLGGVTAYLAMFQLHPYSMATVPDGFRVRFDDVLLFERVVDPNEVKALSKMGRSGWRTHINRVDFRQTWKESGWVLACVLLVRLFGALCPPIARALAHSVRSFSQPGYRAVWGALFIGLGLSVVVSWRLSVIARETSRQQFTEQVRAFEESTDLCFERLADMLLRARDWVSVRTNLTAEGWAGWLANNNVPHDYGDYLLGVGYAQRVSPGELGAHEAEWAAKHRYPYRVCPPLGGGLGPLGRTMEGDTYLHCLTGEPRLPVVVYQSGFLPDSLWRTNETILGRDLLTPQPSDPPSTLEAARLVTLITFNEIQPSPVIEVVPATWTGTAVQGIRLYAPIAEGEAGEQMTPESPTVFVRPADRWTGVVFASVGGKEWLRHYYGGDESDGLAPGLAMRVFTGEADGTRHELLADSRDLFPSAPWRPDAEFNTTVEIKLYHRRLWIDVCSTPSFSSNPVGRLPWLGGSIGGCFTLLTTGLLLSQVRSREKQASMLEELRVANAELSRAARDRARWSRDLHDGTIQRLYAVGLHLQFARRHVADPQSKAAHGVDEGQRLVQDTIVDLRQFLLSLRPEPTTHRTFRYVMNDIITGLQRTTPVEFALAADPASDALSTRTVIHLANVVREAISNALRHGEPSHVSVTLRSSGRPNHFQLEIYDNGCGFDPERSDNGGFGLLTMRERAAELKGTFSMKTTSGKGTRIIIEFPSS